MDTRNLAWDDFKLARLIAEAGGLAGAAARLKIDHSTAFRRLARFEETLGVKLFERHRTGYVPTPAGEEMITLAGRMDDDVSTFARKLAGAAPAPSGELRITTNDALLILLTPVFARFCQRFPDIRLDVVLANDQLNLSKRDADVAIRANDDPPETLVGRRLATIGWAIYGRAADFPEPTIVAPASLREHSWVALGESMNTVKMARFLSQHAALGRIIYKVNSVLSLSEAVEAGIGISPLPCFLGDAGPALVRLSQPIPEFSTALWLLTHPDLRQSTRVRAFLDFVAAEVAGLRKRIEGGGS